ncbi:MAG TPA: gamma-glutamyltransferase [Caldilineaceae bacterium]|mgnify:CR=1 FL=1|nr:gamma-glutamyltransferase [Caldilineaceae bacterium]
MAHIDVSTIGWQASGKTGAVAAGAAGAVAAGIEILAQDGNAADAAAATIFALNVTDHGACSIGGEVPVLIYDAQSGDVKSLSGQGGAPLDRAAIAWYMANGIPNHDMKMAPVPSVVDLCITLLQRYGTKSFADIIAPTLAILDAGDQPWHPNLAKTLRRMVEEEGIASGSREVRLQAACDRFYGRHPERNDIAEELEAFYIAEGGFLRRADLAAHKTLIEEPVAVNYRGYTVYKCGPWTQGPYLCQALRLLEGFDLPALGHFSADYVHLLTEALKLAMADRDAYYGDPNFVDVPLEQLLSDAYTALRRPLIDMAHASHEARPGDPIAMQAVKHSDAFEPVVGGTTTCVVADRWGNVVSATPSANVYHEGGSGSTGVSYGNRLRSLNTTAGHPNCIQPGKRPRITLTPTLVLKEGRPVLAISVAGGDLQDQAALNLLLNHIEFGMMPAQAVTAPRFATDHHEDSFDPNPNRAETVKKVGSLTISDAIDPGVRDELARRGHDIEVKERPVATPVMLYIDQESGTSYAAGDPAAGRHAAALA